KQRDELTPIIQVPLSDIDESVVNSRVDLWDDVIFSCPLQVKDI
ncbi:MAG: hypothetical protein HeimAB125_09180, partial [Candidatus Heimdallarchaeota archaeon AB_125]